MEYITDPVFSFGESGGWKLLSALAERHLSLHFVLNQRVVGHDTTTGTPQSSLQKGQRSKGYMPSLL